jgi:hypothetical protein
MMAVSGDREITHDLEELSYPLQDKHIHKEQR